MNCIKCNDTGEYKQPNDETKFNQLFDNFEQIGAFSLGECYDKALKKVGYTTVPCPSCNIGDKS